MKSNSFVLLLIFCTLTAFAQQKSQVPAKMVLVPGNDQIKPFYMDQYEVTVAEFKKFVDATGYVTEAEKIGGVMRLKSGGVWELVEGGTWMSHASLKKRGYDVKLYEEPRFMNNPVMSLAPADVLAYAKWVGKRVPTYEEWVHAAKAGQKNYPYPYPGGDNLKKVAWYEGNTDSWFPKDVGTKEPNELGIYDLAGGIGELVIFNKGEKKYGLVGGAFYQSKEWLVIGKVSPAPLELNRPSQGIGFRLVKDVN
ncbi:SUMF1/EgtB/PvdO family nonheme iron enzyme [Algoriphagus sp. AK58]|uniref:formylglycine-generating enzyme family protein n=1 Tax=Algoriphagus sp. AK58 TaxID=1406877 RepID=UPI001650749B|nr:SUMF1/EgtB/PvdO family nonheme iron enzyme [Algoriphagus sp. AK58]MBC6367048.1 serine/threonine-protein kinase pkn1 [Algoriphagus sp. AK58]